MKAFQYGVQGIVLSNHGGRELDLCVIRARGLLGDLHHSSSSPAPMTILYELHQRRPDLLKNDIYIDGGVTRGTDVLKALCLGARSVGLGRAFLYGNGVWGEAGARRVVQSK